MSAVRKIAMSCLVAVACGFWIPEALADASVTADRYVRVKPLATIGQIDPLQTAVTVTFPKEHFQTVGDAALHLLRRSGYALAEPGISPEDAHARLLQFPLPEVHRRFETVAIVQILQALGGPSYIPTIDHVNRTVTFKLGQDDLVLERTGPEAVSEGKHRNKGKPTGKVARAEE